ncbi:MAG: hypothetical protein FJ260_04685 [Planctomycetes bacterium]|nr:hypothetical protein [Planctomycetota bacterium]
MRWQPRHAPPPPCARPPRPRPRPGRRRPPWRSPTGWWPTVPVARCASAPRWHATRAGSSRRCARGGRAIMSRFS